ncbi:hypothetical protein MGH68_04345 [Erysipelothrix sp. D19-032]
MGEPGHGLTGTTPAHAYRDLEELPLYFISAKSHIILEKKLMLMVGDIIVVRMLKMHLFITMNLKS